MGYRPPLRGFWTTTGPGPGWIFGMNPAPSPPPPADKGSVGPAALRGPAPRRRGVLNPLPGTRAYPGLLKRASAFAPGRAARPPCHRRPPDLGLGCPSPGQPPAGPRAPAPPASGGGEVNPPHPPGGPAGVAAAPCGGFRSPGERGPRGHLHRRWRGGPPPKPFGAPPGRVVRGSPRQFTAPSGGSKVAVDVSAWARRPKMGWGGAPPPAVASTRGKGFGPPLKGTPPTSVKRWKPQSPSESARGGVWSVKI